MSMRRCHKCGLAYKDQAAPGFNNLCACGASLHCCANCLHYVAKGKLWCLKPGMPEIRDPLSGNRCDGFEFASDNRDGGGGAIGPRNQSPADSSPDAARKRWDDLFRS